MDGRPDEWGKHAHSQCSWRHNAAAAAAAEIVAYTCDCALYDRISPKAPFAQVVMANEDMVLPATPYAACPVVVADR